MKVEQIRISERPLIDAYRDNFLQVKDFFEYNPNDVNSFVQRYQYLQKRNFQRESVVNVLIEYNQRIGASQKTLANLNKLISPDTVVVITGQQAGVLTGPLYTIYKALTVITLTEDLNAKGIPTVPVFWIASEDHDFQEIAGVYFLNREHAEVEVKLQGMVNRQPIGRLKLESEVQKFLVEFNEATPDTDFKSDIMKRIKDMAEGSQDLGEWFARIMAWLMEDTGIIFVDSLDPHLRKLGQDFFLQVLEKNDQITHCLSESEEMLRMAGYPAQIHKTDNQVHLFLIKNDARYPLDLTDSGYLLRGLEEGMTREEVVNWIKTSPESISTNVVTRPLFQDVIFPTIAYIGGPGETAYYSQFKEIYRLFDMEMPIIYPRISITLIESSIARSLQKYELNPQQIFQEFDNIREDFLAEADELQLKDRFNQIKGLFIPEYQKLIKELTLLDGKFKNLGSQNLQRIIEEINYLEEKAYHQHRKNSEILLRQLDKLKMNLYPNDILQERRLNILPYIFKYQSKLIKELKDLNLLSGNYHYLIYL